MVTNGYISKEARDEVFKNIDAANVDLKAFSEDFYQRLTGSKLQPVLDNLIWLKNETDVWIELTTLLIPGENDNEEELKRMIEWILNNLGPSTPLHFSAFHPDFKMSHYPATSLETIKKARSIALNMGLKYCYSGNVHFPEGQITYCPNCNRNLIVRDWHSVSLNMVANNRCPQCHEKIAGVYLG